MVGLKNSKKANISRQVDTLVYCVVESPGGLVEIEIPGFQPQWSDSAGVVWGLNICI